MSAATHGTRRGARRERHASWPARADRVVSRAAARWAGATARSQRPHAARRARAGRRARTATSRGASRTATATGRMSTLVPCTAVDAASAVASDPSRDRRAIHVKGDADVPFAVRSGPTGVLYEERPGNGPLRVRALARDRPGGDELQHPVAGERRRSVAQALALAPTIGIPHQNLMVGDRRRAHRLDDRSAAFPTRLGRSCASTARRRGPPTQTHPQSARSAGRARLDRERARRSTTRRAEALIGGDEAALGVGLRPRRARASDPRRPRALIAGAPRRPTCCASSSTIARMFLTRWHDLLVKLLDDEAVQGHPQRAEFKRIVDGLARAREHGFRRLSARARLPHADRARGVGHVPATRSTSMPPMRRRPRSSKARCGSW